MRVHKLGSLLLSVALTAFAAGGANAASSDYVAAGEAKVRLLASGSGDTNSAPVFRGGVEVVLTPGWKTYWRYPGDAGIPPRFDWSGSQNLAGVEVFYPAPERIVDGSGQFSIGYETRVIFPLQIRAQDPKQPVTLKLKFDFATCEKLCIPAEAKLSLVFAPQEPAEPALAHAEDLVPKMQDPAQPHALHLIAARVERGQDPSGKDTRVLVKARVPAGAKIDLFAEGPSEEWTLALPRLLSNDAGIAIFAIPLEGAKLGQTEVPRSLRLTLVADKQALEAELPLD